MSNFALPLPLRAIALASLLLPALGATSHAVEIVRDAIGNERGTFNSSTWKDSGFSTGTWKGIEGTYSPRHFGVGSGSLPAQRSYHIFDLSGLEGQTVQSASLLILHSDRSYSSPDASETVGYFEVTTPVADLLAPDETQSNAVLDALFADLGDGPLYGSFEATPASNGTLQEIVLNAAAIAAIQSALGGDWAIGGALTTADQTGFGVEEQVFKGSEDLLGISSQLVLQVVPEPGTAMLLGLGLTLLAARRRTA